MDKYETSSSRPAVHWWYDSKEAGVRNPPPSSDWRAEVAAVERRPSLTHTSISSISNEVSSVVTTGFPIGVQQPRRDSFRNLIHLCDFATP